MIRSGDQPARAVGLRLHVRETRFGISGLGFWTPSRGGVMHRHRLSTAPPASGSRAPQGFAEPTGGGRRVVTSRAAASDDARRWPSLALGHCRSARPPGGDRCRRPDAGAGEIGARDGARAREITPTVEPRGEAARCTAPGTARNWTARPRGATHADSGSAELCRRVTSATPFRAAMAQDKEPGRRLHWTTWAGARQAAMTYSPGFASDRAWQSLYGTLVAGSLGFLRRHQTLGIGPDAPMNTLFDHEAKLDKATTEK